MPVPIEAGKIYIIGIRKGDSSPQFPEWKAGHQPYNVTGGELLRYKTTPDEPDEKPRKIETFDQLISENPLNLLHPKNYAVYEQVPDHQPKFLGEWTVLRLGPAQRMTQRPALGSLANTPVEVMGNGHLFSNPARSGSDDRLYVYQAENKRLADQLEHTQQTTSQQMTEMMNLVQAQMQQHNALMDQIVQARSAEASQQATLKGIESTNQLRDQMHDRELQWQKEKFEMDQSFGAKTIVELAGHLAPAMNHLIMGIADKFMPRPDAIVDGAADQAGPPPPPPASTGMQPMQPMIGRR